MKECLFREVTWILCVGMATAMPMAYGQTLGDFGIPKDVPGKATENKRLAVKKKAPAAASAAVSPAPTLAAPAVAPAPAPAAVSSWASGKEFQDNLAGGGKGPVMVVIPAGSFEMGTNNGNGYEKPVHTVRIDKPFAMGKMEVTQKQWREVMGNNPSHFSSCGDDCPVEQVSWDDAKTFIQRLNAKTGKSYRLPSEAEWEYACRAGGTHTYCGSASVDSVAWYEGNSGNRTHSVAGKQANAWGLHDMSGNVSEWVEDCGHDNYNGAPSDGSAWTSGDCSGRTFRGGGWSLNKRYARSAERSRGDPTTRFSGWGFRLARTLF